MIIQVKNNITRFFANGLKHHIITAPPIPYMRINGNPQIIGKSLICEINSIPLSVRSPNIISTNAVSYIHPIIPHKISKT